MIEFIIDVLEFFLFIVQAMVFVCVGVIAFVLVLALVYGVTLGVAAWFL